jgi:hypothetical protein
MENEEYKNEFNEESLEDYMLADIIAEMLKAQITMVLAKPILNDLFLDLF